MPARPTYGKMDITIQIVRRSMLQPLPGRAEPRHDYAVVLTTRASVQSMLGANAFAQVIVGNRVASHTFTIRYTTIEFDSRDRVRDATGELFQILSVENAGLGRKWMVIRCAEVGDEDREAAR